MTEKKKKNEGLENAYSNQQNGIKQLDEYKNLVNQKTSALSSVGQANKQALKYADNTALAQGYATQGAAMQNMTNLQNAYQNQVGGINQQYQQQLGQLKNTASANAFTNYETELANSIQNGSYSEARLKELQDAYFGQMDSTTLGQAQRYTEDAIKQYGSASTTGYFKYLSDAGTNYETNISDATNKNDKFTARIGEQTYTLKLGKTIDDSSFDPNTLQTGQFTTYEKDGHIYIITKDSNGDIRYVQSGKGTSVRQLAIDGSKSNVVTAEKSELYKLAKALGYNPQKNYNS